MATNIRDGIGVFLKNRAETSPYLIPKWRKSLESQVIVYEGSNEIDSEEQQKVWSDGEQRWSNHRWPANAWGEARYKDRPLTYSPADHIKFVGTTWWDFENKVSLAAVFDVDAVQGHSSTTTTCTEDQIDEIIERARSLPYVTLARSKSGNGIHIYIWFDTDDLPQTNNHNEHSGLARFVLNKMCQDAEFDFNQYVDVVGSVFWFYADERGENGFDLIQEAGQRLKSIDLGDWQDVVLQTKNREITVEGFNEDGEQVSKSLNGTEYRLYDLDETHKNILRELEKMPFSFRWKADFHMAHTHTAALRQLYEKRKGTDNPILGVFETISGGSDPTKPNCYLSPRPGGVFRVARHGNSATEHPLWETYDGDTWCYFNRPAPVLRVLQRLSNHEMTFSAAELEEAMRLFGETIGDSHKLIHVPIKVERRKHHFIATFKDPKLEEIEGWTKSGKVWQKILPVRHHEESYTDTILEEVHKDVRSVITPADGKFGWAYCTQGGRWVFDKSQDCLCIVQDKFGKAATTIKAMLLKHPYKLTHHPFADEYPGDPSERLWNYGAPQLAMKPSTEPGPHPTWDLILGHVGQSLNGVIPSTNWCSQWGITTGADYLRFWVTCLIKYPFAPLPYLFFFGPQNCGKSTLFECLNLLFTPGSVISAGNALISSSGFNSELAGAVVASIDEKNLSLTGKQAYERIKEWTMAETLEIHPKGFTPYRQPNTLHFIQVGNSIENLPLEDGDTRVTAIEVRPIQGNIIPKDKLFDKLREEAPFLLRTLITTDVPDQIGRTRLPVLETTAKQELQKMHQTPLEQFASESLYPAPGHTVRVTDFYEAFKRHCIQHGIECPTFVRTTAQLRNRSDIFTVGRYTGNQNCIANVSLEPDQELREPLVLNDQNRLVLESALDV